MVSTFGNISLTSRRLAENADARLDIRRQDPDQQGHSRQKEEEGPKAAFDTYDNTVISVDSLRVFLENFLKSLYQAPVNTQNIVEKQMDDSEATVVATPIDKAISARASKAASLYQTTARTGARTSVLETPAAPTPAEAGVGNDEIRMIHRLLGEIAILQARKIEYVTIERGDTFLTSLAAAVAKAKQS